MTKQEAKENAEIMLAWAEGRVIQCKRSHESDHYWSDIEIGGVSFNFINWQYRIKPLTFPSPPEGEAWQNPDNLTAEQVGEGYRLLLQSEVHVDHEDFSILSGWSKKRGRWMDKLWGASGNVTYRVSSSTPFHWDSPKKEPWSLGRNLPGFRPLRDGEEWGTPDKWNQDNLKEGWRPLLKNEKAVKGIDVFVFNGYEYLVAGLAGDTPEFNGGTMLKTQRHLPEPAKMVPLEAGDIPLTSLIRNGPHNVSSVVAINNGHVVSSYQFAIIPMDRLQENGWEILRPGSSIWEKCEKEEVKP